MSRSKKLNPRSQRSNGRPRVFDSAEKLNKLIEEYWDFCESHIVRVNVPVIKSNGEAVWEKQWIMSPEIPRTISGLSSALGVDRKTLFNYSKREEFFPTITRARAVCEAYAERQLYSEQGARGAIFTLRLNFGWKNK